MNLIDRLKRSATNIIGGASATLLAAVKDGEAKCQTSLAKPMQ